MTLLAIIIGGFFGAIVRYAISRKIQGMRGILFINWLGSLLMGISLSIFVHTSWLSMFWVMGFLGAFTTFSTFAVQFVENWFDGERRTAITYALLTVIGGFVFVYIGWWIESLF